MEHLSKTSVLVIIKSTCLSVAFYLICFGCIFPSLVSGVSCEFQFWHILLFDKSVFIL